MDKKSSSKKNSSNEKSEGMNDYEMENALGAIANQYVPECLFSDRSHHKEDDLINNNFLFNQLECTDNLDEDINSDNGFEQKEPVDQMSYFSNAFDTCMDFGKPEVKSSLVEPQYAEMTYDYQHMSEEKDQDESHNDESESAAKMLNYLISIEGIYSPDPNFLENYQPDLSSIMRAILVDWMMEVWNEFTLKRETFHYAVNYVDRFLSSKHNIRKEELQLVGVTSMFMAAKMEEVYSPRVADFAKSTDNGYNAKQIIKMEKLMLKELGWRTTPPTYAMWANWYMNQWDIYIATNEYAMTHHVLQQNPGLTFKTSDECAYSRFREVLQILDMVLLDHNCLQYKPRGLVAAVMYLILGIATKEFDVQRICTEFPFTSNGFLDPNSMFNLLFMDFLYLSFGFQLHDLAPTVQYVAPFLGWPFNYDLPMYAQNKNALEGHFEEFLSFQTHHPLSLEFVKQRIIADE